MVEIKTSEETLFSLQIPKNLEKWIHLLDADFIEKRNILSYDSMELAKTLQKAIEYGVIGVSIPESEGGLNLDYKQQHHYYKLLSQISGTFAFFSTQFSTALSIISSGANIQLKHDILKKDGLKNTSIGISTAHLKNFKTPMVNAQEDQTHYVVNGTLRYVSGYNIFNMLVLGFVFKNEEIFALIPFCESKSFQMQPQVNFIAANSTNTVNCTLINHIIKKEMVLSKVPLGTASKMISKSTRHLVSFHIGLACATIDLIKSSSYMKINSVFAAYNYLAQNLLAVDHKMSELPENSSVVPIRIEVAALLNQIFFLGDQIFKGAGAIYNHPYVLIKHEAQIIGATASSEETLIETCKYIVN